MQQLEFNLATHQKRELQQVVDFYDKNLVFFSLSLSIAEKSGDTGHINHDSFTVLLVNNEVRLRNLYYYYLPFLVNSRFTLLC